MKKKIIKISTVPESLDSFCNGQLKMLSTYFEVVAVSSPGPSLDILKKREHVRTITIPMERHISIFKDFVSLVRLIILFLKERPYIVHSMTPKAGLLSMVAAWITRVPVRIHTFTGLVFPTTTGFMQQLLMFMDKVTCFCATYINPEGNGVKNDLINYKITSKSLHVIANGNVRGIDLDYYNRTPEVYHKAEPLIKKDLITFCFIGRMVKDKGINELVNAFKRLNIENNKTRLFLVGPFEDDLDPLLPSTKQIIEDHPAIIFWGNQSDIRPFLMSSDAFVFPSYREGFPNVVLEAGAMSIPSIVTNINGSNEIIIPHLNGEIIAPKDENALYLKMKEWVEKPEILQKMGEKARKIIEERFDRHIIWKALLAEYKKLI